MNCAVAVAIVFRSADWAGRQHATAETCATVVGARRTQRDSIAPRARRP